MTLIRTNTRKDRVRREKAIIDYVYKHQDRHGTDPKMKEAFKDYNNISGSSRKK